jgi:hypothetical protein
MAGIAMASSAVTTASVLPGYEVSGLPISPVQMQIMGATNVVEQQRTAGLTLNGMPVSPHQIRVLTPHNRQAAEAVIGRTTVVTR